LPITDCHGVSFTS